MSETAIDALDTAEQRLRGTMHGGDPETILEALSAFVAALETVRGIGAWRPDPALKARLADLQVRLESDHTLSRLLGDLTRQRLDLLAGTSAADTVRVTYGRRG